MLLGWLARNYIDGLAVGGQGMKEHDRNLREVMGRLQELGMKINVKKAKIGVRKTVYLGYTMCRSSFSLEDYISQQSQNIPPILTKKDLQKLVGVFNVCRSMYPQFNSWMHVIYDLPKGASSHEKRSALIEVWSKVLENHQQIGRGEGPEDEEYHLFTD